MEERAGARYAQQSGRIELSVASIWGQGIARIARPAAAAIVDVGRVVNHPSSEIEIPGACAETSVRIGEGRAAVAAETLR